MPSKVDAIISAPKPSNGQQFMSFLDLVNYYGKFITNISTLLHPINFLADKKWEWSPDVIVKKQLSSACSHSL